MSGRVVGRNLPYLYSGVSRDSNENENYFSLEGGRPPQQHQPCSDGNLPDRLLLVDQSLIFNFT